MTAAVIEASGESSLWLDLTSGCRELPIQPSARPPLTKWIIQPSLKFNQLQLALLGSLSARARLTCRSEAETRLDAVVVQILKLTAKQVCHAPACTTESAPYFAQFATIYYILYSAFGSGIFLHSRRIPILYTVTAIKIGANNTNKVHPSP